MSVRRMESTVLNIVLLINTFLTFAAFILFFFAPKVLLSWVGVQIDPSAYFSGYLVGAAELGIAIISFYARKITDAKALSAICLSNAAFHAFSVVGEILLVASGRTSEPWSLWVNMALRTTLATLFAYFAVRKSVEGTAPNGIGA
jgi:hypothetical protein